ncbi:family 43 glycosylhydrolase [Streptomyces sp. NPDC003247]|uniref:glycoside hydrolase family 43 protein n=1 Tax=Streptomyces sp. NPDC003247 TaxID=3364677 RepID=UPI0036870EE1
MSSELRQPLLPGFNPDPSITRVGDVYYMVTSTFEYLPGIPVYRSYDLASWEHVGNVITRSEQADLRHTPTPGGVWAPTIRHRDGVFYVIVTLMFGSHGCILYTAADPAGPWSDGTPVPVVGGIDPDLVWDEDGEALVTYAVMGEGIFQVAVDLTTGLALEDPRPLWSGTGLHAPEGPHIHPHDGWWYLIIAEGGTERGHAVSVARGTSARGPFEGCPSNPVLSTRSTNHPIQNVGHADMVERPDGSTIWTVLGVRPVGFTRSFSPLGRETFAAEVTWSDGWPSARLLPHDRAPLAMGEAFGFSDPDALRDPGWLSDRRLPTTVGSLDPATGELLVRGEGSDLTDLGTPLIARRLTAHDCTVAVSVDVSGGVGGLVIRHSEKHWIAIEASRRGESTHLTARASLAGLERVWAATIVGDNLSLIARFSTPPTGHAGKGAPSVGGDRIALSAETSAGRVALVELDGRYWSFETTESFTGRVAGVYAREGDVRVRRYEAIPTAP